MDTAARIESRVCTVYARKMGSAWSKRVDALTEIGIDARGDRVHISITEYRFDSHRTTGASIQFTRDEWESIMTAVHQAGGYLCSDCQKEDLGYIQPSAAQEILIAQYQRFYNMLNKKEIAVHVKRGGWFVLESPIFGVIETIRTGELKNRINILSARFN